MSCSPSLAKGVAMVLMPIRCLYCQNDQVTKRGKTATGTQRYRCHNPEYPHQSFLLDPAYKGHLPEIKQQVMDMRLNASGVRDTARVVQISTRTVLNELKKKGRHSHPSIHRSETYSTHTLWRSSSAVGTRPKSTQCGPWWARRRSRDGSGIPVIIGAVGC